MSVMDRYPQNFLKPFLDFLRDDRGIPTVKVVIASLILFIIVDFAASVTPQADAWNGQQKLIALGIIAAIRVASVFASAISERQNRSPND